MTSLLIGVLACGVALAFAEAAARAWIVARRRYDVFPPGQRLRLHIDRDTLPQLEPLVRFDVNSDGERGSEIPRLRSGETMYRVLVAGGSQPEGYLLDQETCWPGALQRLLSGHDARRRLGASHVHVGSVARSGVGSEALDLVFERILPRYPRLSTIIILVGASDVLRWLEEGAPPSPSAPVPVGELFRCHPEIEFGCGLRSSAVAELLQRTRRRVLHREEVHERAGKWIGRARAMRGGAKVIRAAMPDPGPMLVHFERHLRRAIDRARAHADRVILVRQSWYRKESLTSHELAHMWHGGVGQAWRQEVTTYYSIEVTGRLMALMDARASRVADATGVEQVDLMRVLESNLSTYYDFFHLTPQGAATVAAAVARTVLREHENPVVIPASIPVCADLRAS